MKNQKEKLTFSIKTLGCKVNRYESELLAENIKAIGLKEDTFPKTDFIIINGCSVTKRTEAKLRHELHKAGKKRSTHILLCGCISDSLKNYAASLTDFHIFLISGREKVEAVVKTLTSLLTRKKENSFFVNSPIKKTLKSFSNRTRAFIKIQDGCQSFCSYCIIPLLRSTLWSRNPKEIIEEIRHMEKAQLKEIVLTGIHVGRYSWKETNLTSLLQKILLETHIPRIRLSSIEPLEIKKDLIALYKNNQRLCPHFHIPLQSASNTVLKEMNRTYTFEQYKNIIHQIKKQVPRVSFTTDIIVGFPGESEKDFEKSLRAIQEIEFLKVHIFPFSAREGTKAYHAQHKIPGRIILQRKQIMKNVSDETAGHFKKAWLGKDLSVLFEGPDKQRKKWYSGLSKNYLKVTALSEKHSMKNEISCVRVSSMEKTGALSGRIEQ